MNPAEFGKLAARYNLAEIAEACWREVDVGSLDNQYHLIDRQFLQQRMDDIVKKIVSGKVMGARIPKETMVKQNTTSPIAW